MRLTDIRPYRSSVIFLVVVNVIPLIGVLFWEWSAFEVVALYWLENVIIGVFNIFKMIACNPGEDEIRKTIEKMAEKSGKNPEEFLGKKGCVHGIKFFLVPFFTIHYFGFCAGHGFFVFMLLGGMAAGNGMGSPGDIVPTAFDMFSSGPMLLAIVALFASHLFSFFVNYIGKGEYKQVTPDFLMAAPYGRIVVLHVAIIFGGWGIMALGSPVVLLALLVILKTGMDISLHIRSHKKVEENQSLTSGTGSPNVLHTS